MDEGSCEVACNLQLAVCSDGVFRVAKNGWPFSSSWFPTCRLEY